MTAFATTDLPASINTVEKLAVWACQLLGYLYPDLTVVEATNQAARVIQTGPFEVTAVTPTEWRQITRLSMPLNRNWMRDGDMWQQAQDIGSLPIPAEFKS